MKTSVHLWSDIGEFLLEWKMFQTKVVEKVKTRILYLVIPPPPKIVSFTR